MGIDAILDSITLDLGDDECLHHVHIRQHLLHGPVSIHGSDSTDIQDDTCENRVAADRKLGCQLIRDEAIRSSSLAGMTLMLAARELGYDSCPMIGFDPEAVAKLINLPENYIVSFMIPVGKQTKPGWDRGERLPTDRVVAYDTFE